MDTHPEIINMILVTVDILCPRHSRILREAIHVRSETEKIARQMMLDLLIAK